jgi:hypothetical protein
LPGFCQPEKFSKKSLVNSLQLKNTKKSTLGGRVLLTAFTNCRFFVYKYVGKIDSDDLKQPILDRTAEISFETPKLVPVVHL